MKSVHEFFTSKFAHEHLLKILILAVSSPPAAAAAPRGLIGGGRGGSKVGLLKQAEVINQNIIKKAAHSGPKNFKSLMSKIHHDHEIQIHT